MSDKKNKVNHLAIIPDGNRRWAKENLIFNEEKMYETGVARIQEMIEVVAVQNIKFLTIWATSLANVKERSVCFRDTMNLLYTRNFSNLARNRLISENGVRIRVVGEWKDHLNRRAVDAIENAMAKTEKNSKRVLTFLIGYDGRRERGFASLNLSRALLGGRISLDDSVDRAEFVLRKLSWCYLGPVFCRQLILLLERVHGLILI